MDLCELESFSRGGSFIFCFSKLPSNSNDRSPLCGKRHSILTQVFILTLSTLAPCSAKAKPVAKKAAAKSTVTVATRPLWHEWYLYEVAGLPKGYYEETAEKRPKDLQVAISQNWLELEEGGTKTYIGSVARDLPELNPVAFFCERSNAKISYKLDGRSEGGMLKLLFKPIQPKSVNIQKEIVTEKGAFLSNFLPMILAKLPTSQVTPSKFRAIVEDARDGNFEMRELVIQPTNEEKETRGNKCRKFAVAFNGVEGLWWVSKIGKLCEIQLPALQSKIELSEEAIVKKKVSL